MNELHRAYQALGLEPGSSFEAVKQRYRQLAMVWHPDRMHTPNAKKAAEEELKKINQHYELLKSHFAKQHRPGSTCACQPMEHGHTNRKSDASANGYSAHTAGAAHKQHHAHQNPHRQKNNYGNGTASSPRTADESAPTSRKQNYSKAADHHASGKTANLGDAFMNDHLSWQIAKGLAATFIGLMTFAIMGMGARSLITSIKQQSDGNSGRPTFQSDVRLDL